MEKSPQNILIVGDIHGDIGLLSAIGDWAIERELHIVLLGDLVDSFRFNIMDQLDCVQTALTWVDDGRATLIAGNHEMSYIYDSQQCSGYNTALAAHLFPLRNKLLRAMKPCVWLPNIALLITHAGVDSRLWLKHINTLGMYTPVYEILDEAMRKEGSWFYQVGRSRCGTGAYGGPLWCDWSNEFTPIDGIRQVVGHTATVAGSYRPVKGFSEQWHGSLRHDAFKHNWNIDGLQTDTYVLRCCISSGELIPVKIDT